MFKKAKELVENNPSVFESFKVSKLFGEEVFLVKPLKGKELQAWHLFRSEKIIAVLCDGYQTELEYKILYPLLSYHQNGDYDKYDSPRQLLEAANENALALINSELKEAPIESTWDDLFSILNFENCIDDDYLHEIEQSFKIGKYKYVSQIEKDIYIKEEAQGCGKIYKGELDIELFVNPTLVILPIAKYADSLAYNTWYAGENFGHERIIAKFRDYEDKFGALILANTGTVLYIYVEYPPKSIESGFYLSQELSHLASSTYYSEATTLRAWARGITQSNIWRLHERP